MSKSPYNISTILTERGCEWMNAHMPTDMQYKDGLRKDKFLNDLVIEAIKNGDTKKALEYLDLFWVIKI